MESAEQLDDTLDEQEEEKLKHKKGNKGKDNSLILKFSFQKCH